MSNKDKLKIHWNQEILIYNFFSEVASRNSMKHWSRDCLKGKYLSYWFEGKLHGNDDDFKKLPDFQQEIHYDKLLCIDQSWLNNSWLRLCWPRIGWDLSELQCWRLSHWRHCLILHVNMNLKVFFKAPKELRGAQMSVHD